MTRDDAGHQRTTPESSRVASNEFQYAFDVVAVPSRIENFAEADDEGLPRPS